MLSKEKSDKFNINLDITRYRFHLNEFSSFATLNRASNLSKLSMANALSCYYASQLAAKVIKMYLYQYCHTCSKSIIIYFQDFPIKTFATSLNESRENCSLFDCFPIKCDAVTA